MVRVIYVCIFAVLILVLTLCALSARRSPRQPIGRKVCHFCFSLIPPVLGDMIVVSTGVRSLAYLGAYLYYIGMVMVMFALIGFTINYCSIREAGLNEKYTVPVWVYLLLTADTVQLLLNPVFSHAFTLQEVTVEEGVFFQMVAGPGQIYHRVVCYGVMIMIVAVFSAMCIRMPQINRERYAVILISLLAGMIWRTSYILRNPSIDRSMIGFSFFGILIFYFSLYYRPVRLLDRMLADIVSDMDEAVFLFGPENRCIWINRCAQELVGQEVSEPGEAEARLAELFGRPEDMAEEAGTECSIGSDADARHYLVRKGIFRDKKGKVLGTYISIRDVTEEKQRIRQELYAANHDALTGLYTREYLFKKITERLQRHELNDHYVAFIDVRDFKIVNDVFGKEFGDHALNQIADWMRGYSDENCIYGRMGGDSFGSCLPKHMFIPELIERDLSKFTIKKGNVEHHLVIHIGFCDIGAQDEDVSILFDRAYIALKSIRDDFRTHVAFYDSRIREKVRWNQEISGQLDVAIREGQIVPYLQPIADRDGKIVGAEALARWIHPKYGFMPPGDFIPLFESNGMIAEVDRHIWRSACRILSEWKETHPELFISINVSPKDFYLTDVLSDISGMVKEYGVDPGKLRIEVTESSMMSDSDGRMKVMEDFRRLGFIVEMDDFGSGYSSLNMLKNMPVDVLKIDMKFLGSSQEDVRADTILKNIIRLTEDLGIVPLTEGVETIGQFTLLSRMGCLLFQGYYFSKPVSRGDFEALLPDKKE
ncbi:MAG: EAL domain-containing protein [Lachnospiraceae bacterium]|nr:EAL domain-containing protein [Lachnospiraceae bacterium]